MKRRACFFAALFAAFTLLCVLFAFCIPVIFSDHDCAGEDCAICAVISLCRSVIKVFAAASAVISVCAAKTAFVCSFCENRLSSGRSPVSLRVKLLS